MRDYFRLHLVIFLWGLTAALGNLIDLSATQVVLYRSLLAAGFMAAFLGHRAVIEKRLAVGLVLNGMLLGLHWVLFFLAVKVANVSVCMVGMATVAFWTSLLEPLMIRGRKFEWINALLGLIVVFAVYVIYQSESQFHSGLIIAITSALVATVFSIINGQFSGRVEESNIVMYEMAGAALFCAITAWVAHTFDLPLVSSRWMPTTTEWVWLAVLVGACTIFAYMVYVELLRRLTVFTINFANNLEPVYGIMLGAVLFQDHRYVGTGFYIGTALILVAVTLQPFLSQQVKAET